MNTAPQEILDKIVSNLNIEDTVSSHCAIPAVSLRGRTDPVVYLGQAFRNSRFLLACMTDTGSVLSGSRALEYFEPGNIVADSDWDFFVHNDLESVRVMMAALEYSGVEWSIDTLKFSRLLDGDVGCSETIPLVHITGAHRYAARETTLHESGTQPERSARREAEVGLVGFVYDECVLAAHDAGKGWGSVRTSGTATAKVTKKDHNYGHVPLEACFDVTVNFGSETAAPGGLPAYGEDSDSGSVLQGHVSVAGESQKVQLILCAPGSSGYPMQRQTPVMRVSSFYASHVQCFLSGWCAVQLFPEETSKRTAFIWDTLLEASVWRAIDKYKERGYTFKGWEGPYTFPSKRLSVRDRSVLFVDFTPTYKEALADADYPRELFRMLRAGLDMLSWYVNQDGCIELSVDKELTAARGTLNFQGSFSSEQEIRHAFKEDYERFVGRYEDEQRMHRMLNSGVLATSTTHRRGAQLL